VGVITDSVWIYFSFLSYWLCLSYFFYSFLITAYNPKYSFVVGAFLAGASGVAFALFANGFWSALILRTLSGIGVAGIYVGSLVVGSGSSLLISGLFIN
jgi:uncharacterized membrane protein